MERTSGKKILLGEQTPPSEAASQQIEFGLVVTKHSAWSTGQVAQDSVY